MSEISIMHYQERTAKELIESLYKKSQLYPFFGSGFTLGCKSYRGTVPDATGLINGIKKIALSNPALDERRRPQVESIKGIKSSFALMKKEEIIPSENAKRYLEAIFSKVSLPADKSRVLDLDWPGIFTFNIDDAIEKYKGSYTKILPNRPVSAEYIRSRKCIFKIHGDIDEYLAYGDSNLIFTWREYAESINSNASLLSHLTNVSRNGALLFIGCSLDAEIDLQTLSSGKTFARSIFLKKGEPDLEDEMALESYGIKRVIYFDTYEQIYEWLNGTLGACEIEPRIQDIELVQEPTDRASIIEYIAQGGPIVVHEKDRKIARIPSTINKRAIIPENRQSIARNKFTIIRGRRFSGKTTLLTEILAELNEFHCYFFASTEVYSQQVRDTISSSNGSFFIFDSNFLNLEAFKEVIKSSEKNQSRLIFCFDNSDYELYRHHLATQKIEYHEIIANNRLNAHDADIYSRSLNELGLPIYHTKETLLDFAYRVYDEYKNDLPVSRYFQRSNSEELLKVSILVAGFEKATSGQLLAAMPEFSAEDFTRKHSVLFEVESVTGDPGKAIVCNSKPWLFNFLRDAAKEASTKLATTVAELVSSLLKCGYKDTANTLIRFDKLNEILTSQNDHGAARLIRQIYKQLSTACGAIPHYWLQMAKCELMAGKNDSEITDGILYARKVRTDEKERKGFTYYSATLILAQLLCKKYTLTKDTILFSEILETLNESFDNYSNNQAHLEKLKHQYKRSNSPINETLASLKGKTNIFALEKKQDIAKLFAHLGD
ncbi:TPA: SIR2 family protein [Pseudomonas aeruginosa]|nr:SIR2 family protein [Pseudomonas aeruginosa]HBN9630709.1 SIR2 family protein [Pseudomonas aeruginosa]HCF4298626.1 SIR2 family protein [Pseudomonas aeruginosa]HCF4299054.1 SIR2 family protein [Pseudomonas aeruginosa]HCF6678267.1 SIR2 family protein [Pseudomonas aeruginosa]